MVNLPYGVGIIGTGHRFGSFVQTNEEVCCNVDDITPDWIVQKTGIQRRYLIEEGESASSLSVAAARDAIAKAGISAEQIGLIICCTFSADYIYPPLSAKLHLDLGVGSAQIFDLQANCSGFVTGLTTATDRMLLDSELEYALVVGTEVISPFVDKTDVETAIYFSDGAGAAVLGRVKKDEGIRASSFHTDSSNYEAVRFRGGGSSYPFVEGGARPAIDFMEMNGLATWKQAVTHLPSTIRKACERAAIGPDEVDLFIFHQANLRIIEYVMKKMRVPLEKTYTNVVDVGNAGAASLPAALSEAAEKGLVKEGQTVLLAGVGAGFNFAANIWRWS